MRARYPETGSFQPVDAGFRGSPQARAPTARTTTGTTSSQTSNEVRDQKPAPSPAPKSGPMRSASR
jgi:hypothetical protein